MAENNVRSKGFSAKDFLVKNMVVVILVALILGFGLGTAGKFFQANNLINLTTQMAINAMLSAGLTYVIILGGIDISVGSVAALAGVISTLIAVQIPGLSKLGSIPILILPALVVGVVCGSFNGFMISRMNVVPMIATLAMQTIGRGLCFIFSGGTAVSGIPKTYGFVGAGRWLATEGNPNGWIPNITIFVIIMVAAVHILLSKTVFGRHVYATGSNQQVAHLAGVNTKNVVFLGHVICSVMAAMAGVLNASKLNRGSGGL